MMHLHKPINLNLSVPYLWYTKLSNSQILQSNYCNYNVFTIDHLKITYPSERKLVKSYYLLFQFLLLLGFIIYDRQGPIIVRNPENTKDVTVICRYENYAPKDWFLAAALCPCNA